MHEDIGKLVLIKNFNISGFIYETYTVAMQLNPHKPETTQYKVRYLDKNNVIRQIDCKKDDIEFLTANTNNLTVDRFLND